MTPRHIRQADMSLKSWHLGRRVDARALETNNQPALMDSQKLGLYQSAPRLRRSMKIAFD
jgi:hypothetical protein